MYIYSYLYISTIHKSIFFRYQVAELPRVCHDEETRIDVAWHGLLKEGLPYSLLAEVMLGILVLPHGNADCERLFSSVRRNQTEFRPNMSVKLIESLCMAKAAAFASGKACYNSVFDQAFLKKAKSATSAALKVSNVASKLRPGSDSECDSD